MGNVRFLDDGGVKKVLFDTGAVAMHEDCCCGCGCCETQTSTPSVTTTGGSPCSLTAAAFTFNTFNADTPATGDCEWIWDHFDGTNGWELILSCDESTGIIGARLDLSGSIAYGDGGTPCQRKVVTADVTCSGGQLSGTFTLSGCSGACAGTATVTL
jgi:hypothetical protein